VYAGGTSDVTNQFYQARAWLAGHDVFDVDMVGHAAFFPIGHFLIAGGALRAAEASGVPFAFWIKVPAIAADLAAAMLLRRIPAAGPPGAVLYMTSPVTLLASVHHGQLHTVAAVVGAYALWLGTRDRDLAAAVVAALAATVRQHFAILLVPLVRAARERAVRIALVFVVVVVALNVPLLLRTARPESLAAPATGIGTWGYTIVVRHTPRVLALAGIDAGSAFDTATAALLRVAGAVVAAWALCWAFWVWRRPDVSSWRAVLVFVLGFYTVSPGFGVQWLAWVLPFWLVVDRRGAALFSIVAGAYLVATYWVWGFPAKYGVPSASAQLGLLGPLDLAIYAITGLLGIAAWLYCAVAAWHHLRQRT